MSRKTALFFAIGGTLLYVPFFLLTALFASMMFFIFDAPDMTQARGLPCILAALFVPLSVIWSLDLMWSSFISKDYAHAPLWLFLPWAMLIFALTLNYVLLS